MIKEDIKNKEDLINYILLDLYKKVYPVKFGDYFMELSPLAPRSLLQIKNNSLLSVCL